MVEGVSPQPLTCLPPGNKSINNPFPQPVFHFASSAFASWHCDVQALWPGSGPPGWCAGCRCCCQGPTRQTGASSPPPTAPGCTPAAWGGPAAGPAGTGAGRARWSPTGSSTLRRDEGGEEMKRDERKEMEEERSEQSAGDHALMLQHCREPGSVT